MLLLGNLGKAFATGYRASGLVPWPKSDRRRTAAFPDSNFGLLGKFKCVINLDSEISNRTCELGMAKQSKRRLNPVVDLGGQ